MYSGFSHPPPLAPKAPVHHAAAVPLALLFLPTPHRNTAVSLNAAGVSISKYYLSITITRAAQHARTQIPNPKRRNR